MLLALGLSWVLRDVLVIIYVSALFAVVLTPVVQRITTLNIFGWIPGRGIAVAVLLVGVLGGLVLFFVLALPPVIRDLRTFVSDLPGHGPIIVARVKHLPFANKLDLTQITSQVERSASGAATYIFSSLPAWASRIFDVVTTLILTVYFMLEGDEAYQWFLSFFPREKRARLNAALQRAEIRMGKWLLGQGALMFILGIASIIVFASLHLPYYYLLGVLMGLANIIPVAGGLVTIALAAMVAATDSWGKVLGVLIFYVVYTQIENAFLTPRIMRSSVDLPGLAVIVALLFGASLAGVTGALVAVPTAALVSVLIDEYLVQKDFPSVQETAL